jgi:hypothetical protein
MKKLQGNLKGTDLLGGLGVVGWVLLKLTFKKYDMIV